jgi:hypothetical protein
MKKNTIYNLTEKQMVIEFCKLLEVERKKFAVEVPFFNRSIDLVLIDDKNNLCALEFKVHDWKRAVRQAQECVLGADFVYICIPEEKYSENIRREIERIECGLILFDLMKKRIRIVNSKRNHQLLKQGIALLREGFDYSLRNDNYQRLLAI